MLKVNTRQYKASKTNHITKEVENIKLSDRTKLIGDKLVQRDLYSAFLLYHSKTREEINYEECVKDFANFILKQEEVVTKIKIKGDKTKNFGIKAFV